MRCRSCRGRVGLSGFHAVRQRCEAGAVIGDALPEDSFEPCAERDETLVGIGQGQCRWRRGLPADHLEMGEGPDAGIEPCAWIGDQPQVEPGRPILLTGTGRPVCDNRRGV